MAWPEPSTSGHVVWQHLPIPSGPDKNFCRGQGWNICTALHKHSLPYVTRFPEQPVIQGEDFQWKQRKSACKKPFYLCCSMARSRFIIALSCLHSKVTTDTAVFSSHLSNTILFLAILTFWLFWWNIFYQIVSSLICLIVWRYCEMIKVPKMDKLAFIPWHLPQWWKKHGFIDRIYPFQGAQLNIGRTLCFDLSLCKTK